MFVEIPLFPHAFVSSNFPYEHALYWDRRLLGSPPSPNISLASSASDNEVAVSVASTRTTRTVFVPMALSLVSSCLTGGFCNIGSVSSSSVCVSSSMSVFGGKSSLVTPLVSSWLRCFSSIHALSTPGIVYSIPEGVSHCRSILSTVDVMISLVTAVHDSSSTVLEYLDCIFPPLRRKTLGSGEFSSAILCILSISLCAN